MAYCDIGEAGLADMTHLMDSAEASGNWVGGVGPMPMGEEVQPLDLWQADEDAVPQLDDQQWEEEEWQTVPPSRSPPKSPKRSLPVSPPGPARGTSGMFGCLAGLGEAPCRTEEQEMPLASEELAEGLQFAAPASATAEELELAAAIADQGTMPTRLTAHDPRRARSPGGHDHRPPLLLSVPLPRADARHA